jgi:hypothetical protein
MYNYKITSIFGSRNRHVQSTDVMGERLVIAMELAHAIDQSVRLVNIGSSCLGIFVTFGRHPEIEDKSRYLGTAEECRYTEFIKTIDDENITFFTFMSNGKYIQIDRIHNPKWSVYEFSLLKRNRKSMPLLRYRREQKELRKRRHRIKSRRGF